MVKTQHRKILLLLVSFSPLNSQIENLCAKPNPTNRFMPSFETFGPNSSNLSKSRKKVKCPKSKLTFAKVFDCIGHFDCDNFSVIVIFESLFLESESFFFFRFFLLLFLLFELDFSNLDVDFFRVSERSKVKIFKNFIILLMAQWVDMEAKKITH